MIKVRRLGHATISTPDLDAQTHYYGDILGLRVIERGKDRVILGSKQGYEAIELVMIIGKEGTDIPKAKFKDYVAGYAMGLDMTCRGSEDRSFRKSIDGYSVIGPWMVTADEIANPDDLVITLHCNDELRQTADTTDLIYDCGRLIEFASEFYTLYPGDVYFTGTPHGVGPVKAGDTLRGKNDVLGELVITARQHKIGG